MELDLLKTVFLHLLGQFHIYVKDREGDPIKVAKIMQSSY